MKADYAIDSPAGTDRGTGNAIPRDERSAMVSRAKSEIADERAVDLE